MLLKQNFSDVNPYVENLRCCLYRLLLRMQSLLISVHALHGEVAVTAIHFLLLLSTVDIVVIHLL